jgi:hypothetical protein
MLRKIYETKRGKATERYKKKSIMRSFNSHYSPDVTVITSRRIRWADHVASMKEVIHVYKEKRSLP